MSLRIHKSQLDKDDWEEVSKDLEIAPKEPFVKSKFGGKTSFTAPSTPPFSFFDIDGEHALVPLSYARTKFDGLEDFENDSSTDEKIVNFNLDLSSSFNLRDHQNSIIEEAENLLESPDTGFCANLQVATGVGKTAMAVYIAVKKRLRTLILVPRTTLVPQWVTTIKKLTPDASIIVPNEPSKQKASDFNPRFHFIVSMATRAKSIPEEVRKLVDLLIVDEAHMLCTKGAVGALLSVSPRHVISLSATLPRADGCHKMVRLLSGEHDVNRVNDRYHEVHPTLVPVHIPEKLNKQGTLDFTSLSVEIANNEKVQEKIVELAVCKENENRKILIFCKYVSQTESIAAKLKTLIGDENVSTLFGKAMKYKDARILVATSPKAGTGFDAATFAESFDGVSPDMLILTQCVKSWQLFTQIVGRVLRCDANVVPKIYVLQTLNRITQSHFKGLRSQIKKINGKVVE